MRSNVNAYGLWLFLFVKRLAARNGVALGAELLMQLKRIPAAVRLGEHALEGHVQARRAQLLQKRLKSVCGKCAMTSISSAKPSPS